MDPAWIELVKVGGPVLAFAVILLYVTLRDKDRMAAELNKDKQRILDALTHIAEVVANNTTVMGSVQKAIEKCQK